MANFKVETLTFITPSLTYGIKDVYADENGNLRIWLPNGDFQFAVDEDNWVAHVDGAATTAGLKSLGVTVNGVDVANFSGDGWTLDRKKKNVSLTGAGPYEISGSGTDIGIKASTNCTVTLYALVLSNRVGYAGYPFDCGTNSVSMSLWGKSKLFASASDIPAVGISGDGVLDINGSGSLYAQGGDYAAGIGSSYHGAGGTVSISGGTVTAQGGTRGAGIGSGCMASGTSVSISGGTVTATGGYRAASIGGGCASSNNLVVISGGTITAKGAKYAPGIGSGDQENQNTRTGDAIEISGGIILATGGQNATSIGSSDYGACESVKISGGTIRRPSEGMSGIGASSRANSGGGAEITGGAVYRSADEFRPAPTNAAGLVVELVEFNLQKPDEKIEDLAITRGGEAYSYGTKDLYTDANGKLRIWLPDGEYKFVADKANWHATVAGSPVQAQLDPYGVTVNGVDVSEVSGEGWEFYLPLRTVSLLTGSGQFVVSGAATGIVFNVKCDCSLTLDSLFLDDSGRLSRSPFECDADITVDLVLVGENTLKGGENAAALCVPKGTGKMTISGDGSIVARGGEDGAGIGSSMYAPFGTLEIAGGTVAATGGWSAPGIGLGTYGNGGTVLISGGKVAATGGLTASGIGAGFEAKNCSVAISGGTVTARGGQLASGIGDALGSKFTTVTIAGGSVRSVFGGVSPAASNAAERVWCVEVPGCEPGAKVDGIVVRLVSDFSNVGYGTNDIFADADGKIYLWVPSGETVISIDGRHWSANVTGADVTTAVPYEDVHAAGVLVDGVDAARGCGTGWTWQPDTSKLSLSGEADCTLSGANNSKAFMVSVASDATVTLDGLNLNANNPFELATGVSATIALGERQNVIKTDFPSYTAIDVPQGATLTITNVAENGKLTAIGGNDAAGIGGRKGQTVGTIRIAGGTIFARSGEASGYACSDAACGAGIGSGNKGRSGDIYITGGRIYAFGGTQHILIANYLGAGIGGGDSSNSSGCRIEISGGTILARGGKNDDSYAADIGDGYGAAFGGSTENGYTVVITGGSVYPIHVGADEKEAFTQSKVGGTNRPRNANGAIVELANLNVGAANRRVQFSGLENYGTNDIWSDDNGVVHLWLPSGTEPPTPSLMSAAPAGGASGALYDFMANGYRCTVTAASGTGLLASSERMECEGFVINGFAVEDGKVRMNVTAEPETWLAGFLETVTVRASETLPIPATDETRLDLTGAECIVEPDGSATYVIPLPVPAGGTVSGAMFFTVETSQP